VTAKHPDRFATVRLREEASPPSADGGAAPSEADAMAGAVTAE